MMPKRTSNSPVFENRNREFTALVDEAPDIIARLDDRGHHLYLNRAGEEAFGIGDANDLARAADDLRCCDEALRVYSLAMRALSSDANAAFFDFQLRIDGKTRYFNARVIPDRDPGGQVTSLLMVARDVTRCAEAEIERDAALMREREARQEASDKIQALADAHRQTLAKISHELRSPLNGIQSWTHVLESYLATDSNTVRRALTGIKTGVEQQVSLLNEMLECVASQSPGATLKAPGPGARTSTRGL